MRGTDAVFIATVTIAAYGYSTRAVGCFSIEIGLLDCAVSSS
jgi:hypothetical protein